MKKIVHQLRFVSLFTPHRISFLNEHFSDREQLFFVEYAPPEYLAQAPDNVRPLERPDAPAFLDAARAADLVIFDGILNAKMPVYLAGYAEILAKAVWIVWDSDLYWHKYQPTTPRTDVEMAFRRKFIAGLHGVVAANTKAHALVEEWYPTRAKKIAAVPVSFPFEHGDLDRLRNTTVRHAIPSLQLGNSANPSNEHLEMIDWFAPHRERIGAAYAPLSYGDQAHALRVIAHGERHLGACFRPMTEILPAEEYNRHLASLDALILNHRRTQASQNTIIALYLGVKVFLREGLYTWELFSEGLGCRLFDTASIPDLSFDEITAFDQELQEQNRRQMTKFFDPAWQKANWEIVYAEPL